MQVPDLSCESIYLKSWRTRDAAILVQAWHDRDIIAGSKVPENRSLEDARKWITNAANRLETGSGLDLVVKKQNCDEVLGEVSLHSFNWEKRAAKIGWWMLARARGQGLATRAVNLLSAWALNELLSTLVAEIKHGNEASLHLAARCGFQQLKPATDETPAVFVKLKSEDNVATADAQGSLKG